MKDKTEPMAEDELRDYDQYFLWNTVHLLRSLRAMDGLSDSQKQLVESHCKLRAATVREDINAYTTNKIIEELEAFRANTGQYEMERDYPTPSGQHNWNVDIKVRNKLKKELDHKLQDRIKALNHRKDEK